MEVFKVKGYKNQWDGTDKLTGGNDLPDGAYYYVITMEGTDKVYKGAISLVRGKR
jgi:beta-xylosidase